MVVQRSCLGVHGRRRKVLVTFWLALAIVLVTMCRGVNAGGSEISSKTRTQNWRTPVRQETNQRPGQETSSNSSNRHRFYKNGSSSSRGLEFREAAPKIVNQDAEGSSERFEFVGADHHGVSSTSTYSRPSSWNVSSSESRVQGDKQVPRIMLELYEASVKSGGNRIPYQANTVRCFPALSFHNDSGTAATDSRGYEGRSRDQITSQTFSFRLRMHKGELFRNLLLRLHAIVKRKQSPVGLEGRVRVSMVRCFPTDASGDLCHDLQLAWKDVYLHNHSWLSFSIRGALRHLQRSHDELVTLKVQLERIFQTVGDPGELRVDDSNDINFQPIVLLYSTQPRRAHASRQRRSLADVDWEGFEEEMDMDEEMPLGHESDRSGRRAGRRRRTKNACKRKPLRVDFASIGWSDWVIAPSDYEAYQCNGKCFYPLASHLSPTKHAVIQTLMHSKSTDRARRACCVPTKLGPISLLYKEDGVMTFKKEYDGMVALECGCR